MAKRFKLKEGDIFTIPLEKNEVGIGQIISFPRHQHNFIMIVFDKKFKSIESIDLSKINSYKILLLGYTVDAKLYHKDWVIIDNITENISKISLPYFKLGLPNDDYPDGARLVDYKGNVLANINRDIFDKLMFQTEVGPIRFEKALRAHFGLQEWISEDYDKILYEKTLESVKIAEEILK